MELQQTQTLTLSNPSAQSVRVGVDAVNHAVSRTFYGIAILAFGILHLAYGDFVTRVVPWWPAAIPGRSLWAYVIGALLVAAGAALVLNRRTVEVSTLLASGLMLSFLLLGIPLVAADTPLGGSWTVAGKILALCGGALLLSAGDDRRRLWIGTSFFAAFLVVCGIQHFIWTDFVDTLVPSWIPPGARFWTYFAGIALIAGGLGLLLPKTTRLAGLLTGLMIFSWVFLVHIPRAIRMQNTNELTAVFEALAMTGIAWLAARTR
jgi:uncharacterized membrane protein